MRKILPPLRKFAVPISALALTLAISVAPALAVAYKSPISFSDWYRGGNTFPGGFEGFCIAYNMLSPEHKSTFKSAGQFGKFEDITNFAEVDAEKFRAEFKKKWNRGNNYAVSVE